MAIDLYTEVDGLKINVDFVTRTGGEESVLVHAYKENLKNPVINAFVKSSSDVMRLVMLCSAIRGLNPQAKISLCLPYVPYARQDRICGVGEDFGIKAFTAIINSLNFEEVEVWDPHSDVTPALLNNCTVLQSANILSDFAAANPNLRSFISGSLLIAPDAGAGKKVADIAKAFHRPHTAASKQRRSDGSILGVEVYYSYEGDILICDDICDGGRTFIELVKEIKHRGLSYKRMGLYVTHGIFSYGLDGMFEAGITDVFSANNIAAREFYTHNQPTAVPG